MIPKFSLEVPNLVGLELAFEAKVTPAGVYVVVSVKDPRNPKRGTINRSEVLVRSAGVREASPPQVPS